MCEATVFRFTTTAYDAAQRALLFSYACELPDRELTFTEQVTLPPVVTAAAMPEALWRRLVEGLHLLLGVSYWKLYCPPRLELPYRLSELEARFWTTVYRKGLGEFFYRNELNLSRSPIFPVTAKGAPAPVWLPARPPRSASLARGGPREAVLVGIGGGKDSFVAAELLKAAGFSVTGFMVETQRSSPLLTEAATSLGVPVLAVRRELDSQLLGDLADAYRGHVPVSAIYAWLGYLVAAATGMNSVAVGNEQSSNEGNIKYQGETINHQWSKSSEFEALFQEYARAVLTPDVIYFSVLRPFSELRIARMFSTHSQYLPVFSSCNRNFTAAGGRPFDPSSRRADKLRVNESAQRWCSACPKCAFSFLLLAANLPREQVIATFGSNFLDEARLLNLFGDVLGFGGLKPFDCVGTFAEAQAALHLASRTFADSLIVQTFAPRVKDGSALVEGALRTARAETVPHRFRFLGMEQALLLGYGREGRATEQYLRAVYPDLTITHADQTEDSRYLDAQATTDISVRTPGIAPNKMRGHYTTATNMFFSRWRGPVIGVTGSKGKSTTASLLYAMLRAAGRDSRLLGNIGTPMLGALLDLHTAETVAVLELSSYQLADCLYSPHVAVVTALFPDHLDYHGDFARYAAAKENIVRWQRPDDFLVFNPVDKRLAAWRALTPGTAVPFAEDEPVTLAEIPLLGAHNRMNVRAAVAAARLLGIPAEAMAAAIRSFTPLPHRLQRVGTWRGITFYDDALSTTPESTIAALQALNNVQTIFLGGTDRGYDFTELERVVRERGVRNVVLFPDSGQRMFADRRGLHVLETDRMREAVAFAYARTPVGAVCLLSTASPSYSLWDNFEAQGNEFQRHTRELGTH